MPQTLVISGTNVPVFPGQLMPHWIEAASAKGYDLVARIIDRFHLALRCRRCGALIKVRLYTLMSAQPLCSECVLKGWITTADAAGLEFVDRCPDDRHYGVYKAPCGHKLRRQFEIIERAAAGETGLRCEVCHKEYVEQEAIAEGWKLLAADLEGNSSYRLYQHIACGHTQRIARANIQTGRVSCGGCGEDWPAAPSYLYVMQFTLPNSRELLKLGYSNKPESRMRHQLIKDPEMSSAILRSVAVRTGQIAVRLEKALHRKLRKNHPNLVVDPGVYREALRVKSEIYEPELVPTIFSELDRIADCSGSTSA